MCEYKTNLSSQLSYVSLDLLDMADEAETLQKLENCHEILRDATTDDRLLATRNLTNNLRLQVIRTISTTYRAAPSEFPSEISALIAEHNSFCFNLPRKCESQRNTVPSGARLCVTAQKPLTHKTIKKK